MMGISVASIRNNLFLAFAALVLCQRAAGNPGELIHDPVYAGFEHMYKHSIRRPFVLPWNRSIPFFESLGGSQAYNYV